MKFFLLWAAILLSLAPGTAQVKVAVFSLNDFHGGFVRNDSKGIAGAPSVWQTLDSLKREYPCHVTVSAGDAFGGSYFYQATKGRLMPVFFNDLGIRISAVGNHEFDEGQRALAAKWSHVARPADWDLTYVCANIRQKSDGRIPSCFQPVASVPVTLPGGQTLRVAFVGLTASSTPMQTSARNVAGLTFDGNYPAVLDSVMQLPEHSLIDDAHLRLLLTHIGTYTDTEGRPAWDDMNADRLRALDSPLWDGILSSHSHQLVCGRINAAQYPIVQGSWHGDFISMLLCTIDTARMVVTHVEPRTVRVTPKDKLEPGPAHLQAQIDSLLQHTTMCGLPIGTVLTTAKADMPHDRTDKYRQSPMGELVCRAYAEAFRTAAHLPDGTVVIGCSHFGSIRSGFGKGAVSVLDVGEALPFSNKLKIYKLTGKQLHELTEFGLNNKRYGWLQLGNAQAVRNHAGRVEAIIYRSPAGKREVLQPKKKYYLVTDEFITNGGDGYSPDFFPANQEVRTDGLPTTTDAFITYLRQQTEI